MKTDILLLLSIIILFLSCKEIGENQRLSEIEALKNHYPDSALVLLETTFVPAMLDDKTLGRWCLLNGAVRDSLRKTIDIEPELLNRTARYYERNGELSLLARTSYYLGRVYYQRKDYNKASETYAIALHNAKEVGDLNLIGYIYAYMGDLYRKQFSFKKALSCYEESAKYFLKTNNQRSYIFSLRDIGEAHCFLKQYDESLNNLQRADSMALEYGDSLIISFVKNNLGNLFLEIGKYEFVENYLLESVKYKGEMCNANLFSLSDFYLKENKYNRVDSLMSFYIQKDNGDKLVYWEIKYELARSVNDIDSQIDAKWKTCIYYDRIITSMDSVRVSEIIGKYEYSKNIEENISLAYKSRNRFMWIFICIVICLLFFIIYQYKVITKNQELQWKYQELEDERNKSFERELKLKEQELEFREEALEFRKQKHKLEMQINRESETKKGLLKGSLMFKKVDMLSEFSTRSSTAFKAEAEKVMNSSALSESDWCDIKNEINYVYPDFTVKLSQVIPKFTEEEIRFCCLLKAGLDTPELSVLLNISPQSVNKRRARINKKIRELYPDGSWSELLHKL